MPELADNEHRNFYPNEQVLVSGRNAVSAGSSSPASWTANKSCICIFHDDPRTQLFDPTRRNAVSTGTSFPHLCDRSNYRGNRVTQILYLNGERETRRDNMFKSIDHEVHAPWVGVTYLETRKEPIVTTIGTLVSIRQQTNMRNAIR